ncbi:hypothetical protein BaRGS_00009929, partial [Batillaria attramentaria]
MAVHVVSSCFLWLNFALLINVADFHPLGTKRSDDVSVTSLEALVQQQAVVIQSLQTKQTATDNRLGEMENLVHSQATQIAALKTRLSSVSKA